MKKLLTLVGLCFLLSSAAHAHKWYDGECCNEGDCSAIPLGQVSWTPDGWRVEKGSACRPWVLDSGGIKPGQVCTSKTEIIPFDDARIHHIPPEANDKDAQMFHGCVRPVWTGGKVEAFVLRCLYAPGSGN